MKTARRPAGGVEAAALADPRSTSPSWSSERAMTMDAFWTWLTTSWMPFIIGGILIVVLLAIFIFLRMRKTDE
jgi:hypothetical protein